ncbi:MAG: IMP dehydrogenase [Candidatus Andersenbacteria bacterium]|nr:IMP dehydrogenase [Candidatus Andersenbacteria bacterium]
MNKNLETFFAWFNDHGWGLAYGDARLRPGSGGMSRVKAELVDLETKFSRHVSLKVPIIGAAMDTVTEYPMGIALAEMGGLGIIHRNLSPKDQAFHVSRVKRHLHGLILDPICFQQDCAIREILNIRREKQYPFQSFLIVDADGKLVGVLTGNDFELCNDVDQQAREVMSVAPVCAPPGTTIDGAYALMREHHCKLLPIKEDDGRVAGLYTLSDVKRITSGRSKLNNLDEHGQLRVGAAVGTDEDTLERVKLLVEAHVDVIVIDKAHIDTDEAYHTLQVIKSNYGRVDVVVGNVSEPESAQRILEGGADGIKIGQGPGSICTTRIIAGVGCPQLTAVYNCSLLAQQWGVPACADGGIVYSGDIPIAIGAGASSVMLGNLLAGTDEAPGTIVHWRNRDWKEYRGMGSLEAMQERPASRERYGQAHSSPEDLVPEGVSGRVPYRGPLKKVMTQLIGGLRQGMWYVGVSNIELLRERANFRYTPGAAKEESHPHDVSITHEPPNYHVGSHE